MSFDLYTAVVAEAVAEFGSWKRKGWKMNLVLFYAAASAATTAEFIELEVKDEK